MTKTKKINISFAKVTLASFYAAVAGIILNNLYSFLFTNATGFSYPLVNIASISFSSLAPVLVAGLVYYLLVRFTKKGEQAFYIIGILFLLFSFMGPLSSTLPDGAVAPDLFASLTLPMHLISGIIAIYVIPTYSSRRK